MCIFVCLIVSKYIFGSFALPQYLIWQWKNKIWWIFFTSNITHKVHIYNYTICFMQDRHLRSSWVKLNQTPCPIPIRSVKYLLIFKKFYDKSSSPVVGDFACIWIIPVMADCTAWKLIIGIEGAWPATP